MTVSSTKKLRPENAPCIALGGDRGSSGGAGLTLLADFVDIGLDIYDTIQPEAAGMTPNELASEFGRQICLHGTISTLKLMPFGTRAEIAAVVRDRIETIGANGGLILARLHKFQPDTSIENVVAMYEAIGIRVS